MKDRPRLSSLRAQILLRTLVVGLVPLAVLAVVAALGLRNLNERADASIAASRQTLAEETVTARLESEARAAGREIDLVLSERIDDVTTWATQQSVIDGARTAGLVSQAQSLATLQTGEVEALFAASPSLAVAPLADAFLAAELGRLSEFVDISYTDSNGFNAGVIGVTDDFVQSDEFWWQRAWETGGSIGGPVFHTESGRYVIPISARIDSADGVPLGVLRASLDIGFIQTIADFRTSDGLQVTVTTANRQLLADTATGHDPTRIGATDPDIAGLSPSVEAALVDGTATLIVSDAVYGFSRVASTSGAGIPGEGADRLGWVVVTSQPTSSAFASLDGLTDLNQDLRDAGNQLSIVALIVLAFAALVATSMATFLSHQIVTPITLLTKRARLAAGTDLPHAVAIVQDGGSAPDPLGDTTIDIGAGNELDELAQSFNSVQQTAIRLAGEQAMQRRGTAEMFANLGRRNQSLVKRQLRFIEGLERSEEDPERLASLFKLDHLATRMRRNAESLLVIAGNRSPSRRSNPIRVELVAQAALGEVENFERVDASSLEPVAVHGRAVGDVAHILAELVENALSFSPPDDPVLITGRAGQRGYTLTVTDRGIGMSHAELANANERVTSGVEIDLAPSKQLGLLVVSKLAAHHQIAVRLTSSEGGGITADIELPAALLQPVAATATPEAKIQSPAPQHGSDETVQNSIGPTGQGRHTPTPTPVESHDPHPDQAQNPLRRKDDVVAEPRPEPVEDMAPYLGGLSRESEARISNVTRRVSRRPIDPSANNPGRSADKEKRSVAVTDSIEEVESEAVELRTRWASFQRGRQAATPETSAFGDETGTNDGGER